jgi:hypothetical protein
MLDALALPDPVPSGYDAAAGYLQSPGVAVGWTVAEWERAAAACRYLLPIVGYEPGQDAVTPALKGAITLKMPMGAAIALDVEASVSSTHAGIEVSRWSASIAAAGYWPLVYCSASYREDFPDEHLWLAQWGPNPPAAPWAAWQNAGNVAVPDGVIDTSLVADNTPLWDTRSQTVEPTYVDLAVSPHGGYAIVRSDGAVYTYGGAPFYGGANGKPLAAPIVSITWTATGRGYYLLGADGGVFTFGDAVFAGNPTKEP